MARIEEYRISFANKYYTLWWYEFEHIVDVILRQEYDICRMVYIKNISMNRDVAFSKHPNLVFDESLKGKTRSFEYRENVVEIFEPNTFRFGRYKHTKFEDCIDYSYMKWYFNSQRVSEITEDIRLLVEILEKTYVLYNNGRWYEFIEKNEYEKIVREEEIAKNISNSILTNGWAIIEIVSNWCGEIKITSDITNADTSNDDDYDDFTSYDNAVYLPTFQNSDKNLFILPNELTRYYEASYYSNGGYKPTIKGKGKNLKGKQIKVYATKADIRRENAFNVISFEIL